MADDLSPQTTRHPTTRHPADMLSPVRSDYLSPQVWTLCHQRKLLVIISYFNIIERFPWCLGWDRLTGVPKWHVLCSFFLKWMPVRVFFNKGVPFLLKSGLQQHNLYIKTCIDTPGHSSCSWFLDTSVLRCSSFFSQFTDRTRYAYFGLEINTIKLILKIRCLQSGSIDIKLISSKIRYLVFEQNSGILRFF